MFYDVDMKLGKARTLIAVAIGSLVGGVVLSYGFQTMAAIPNWPVGQLFQAGINNIASKESNPGWTWNSFSCDTGYSPVGFHYEQNSSNDSMWYECQ